jgi:citrate lyase subunit beta/citryl-CoA lyase
MTAPARIRRSELAVPASSPKMIEKSARSDADLVFLDLEDAVAPALKVASRDNVVAGLSGLDWGRTLRAVRVNSADTEWASDDVISVVEKAGQHLDLLILPKVKAPRDVWFFETLLEQLEAKLGLGRKIGFEALIEEAEALSRVEEIAACSPRLEALILGFGDLAASLGFRFGHESDPSLAYPGDPWHAARARMIAACRANGIDAIDGPFANFKDPETYRRDATWASTLGAVGKWCIHPSQIEIANEVFAPSEREIAIARRMCEAYEASEKEGAGAASAGGTLVDAASVRIFAAVLDRARLTGRIES